MSFYLQFLIFSRACFLHENSFKSEKQDHFHSKAQKVVKVKVVLFFRFEVIFMLRKASELLTKWWHFDNENSLSNCHDKFSFSKCRGRWGHFNKCKMFIPTRLCPVEEIWEPINQQTRAVNYTDTNMYTCA